MVLNYTWDRRKSTPWRKQNGLNKYECYKEWIAFHCSCTSSVRSCSPSTSFWADSHQCFTFLHPLSFFLSSIPSLFLLPIHSAHTQKPNYNTAKPIWEQQASHSVGVGRVQCFLPSKPQNCSMSNRAISALCNSGIAHQQCERTWSSGEPFGNHDCFNSCSEFWWLRHVELAISVHQRKQICQCEAMQ